MIDSRKNNILKTRFQFVKFLYYLDTPPILPPRQGYAPFHAPSRVVHRCRFDRQYMRKSKLSREHKAEMIPVYFELIGLEKVVRSQKFASDHWGILSHFKINIV